MARPVTVRIHGRDGLQEWLESKPAKTRSDIAIIFANRAALRVLPFLTDGFDGRRKQHHAKLTTSTLRCLIISRVAATHPTRKMIAAARSARAAVAAANATNAAANAIANALGVAASAADAADAADFTTRVTYASDFAAYSAIWKAISQDAATIEFNPSVEALRDMPLWPDNKPPNWWLPQLRKYAQLLDNLDDSADGQSGHWDIWNEWFSPIITGQPAFSLPRGMADELEKRIALGNGDKNFWDRKPEEINFDIAVWVAEARLQAAKQLPPELPSETELPESFPEVPQFTRGPDGKIRMEADPPNPRASRTEQDLIELYEEAREKAIALGKLSPNQLGLHKDIVHKFIEHLQQNLSGVSINRLWSKAQSLRHILAIHLAEMQKPKDERETSYLLESEFATKLADAIEQYNVFNVADNRGRQLDLERHGPEARKMAEDALAIAKNILPELEDIVDQRSLQQTIEENEIATNTSTTLPIDQEKQRVAKLDANLFIQVLRVARQIVAKFNEAGAELKIGATEQFLNLAGPHGLEIIAFVTKHHDAILAFASALKIAGGVGALLTAIVYLMK